jgi:transposase
VSLIHPPPNWGKTNVTKKQKRGKLVDMRNFTHVHRLTGEEQARLAQGTKSKSGFTVRRSHILLLSAEGYKPQAIAARLHCGEQTARRVIHAFEREGLACLQEKSRRPHHDYRVFDAAGLRRLEAIIHQSPRDFGLPTSLWTLPLLAKVCFQEKIVARPISYETVRRGLLKLGIDWRRARQRITSHDPHYERKKASAALD